MNPAYWIILRCVGYLWVTHPYSFSRWQNDLTQVYLVFFEIWVVTLDPATCDGHTSFRVSHRPVIWPWCKIDFVGGSSSCDLHRDINILLPRCRCSVFSLPATDKLSRQMSIRAEIRVRCTAPSLSLSLSLSLHSFFPLSHFSLPLSVFVLTQSLPLTNP